MAHMKPFEKAVVQRYYCAENEDRGYHVVFTAKRVGSSHLRKYDARQEDGSRQTDLHPDFS